MDATPDGRAFRDAWIRGVRRHHPGEPKHSYVAPWEDTPEWERASAAAVYDQVRGFILGTDGQAVRLTRAQKGRFVALCWIGQILRHFAEPKRAHLGDWDDMPQWQRETDADIFEHIERTERAR